MRILIYGAGVQGSYLAHELINGGNDVTILARGSRLAELREQGLVIRHYFQRKTTREQVRLVSELAEQDHYDLIFVTMKYTDFPSVLPILARNISEHIILVGNNLTAQQMADELQAGSVRPKQIVFGFQLNGGKREAKQMVCIRFGKGEMVIGALDGKIPFQALLDEAFKTADYKLTYEANIDAWLKSHTIMIMPLNSAAYLHDQKLKATAKDKVLLKQVVAAMAEGYQVLTDLGYEIIPAGQATFVQKHPRLAYLGFKLYHRLPMAKLVDGSTKEIVGLYEDFAALIERSGQATPNFDILQKRTLAKFYQTE